MTPLQSSWLPIISQGNKNSGGVLGVANIKNVIESLTLFPVTVVTTHIHWDHIGGHKYFNTIAVHEAEKEWLSVKFPIPLQIVKGNLICKHCNFPSDFKIDDD